MTYSGIYAFYGCLGFGHTSLLTAGAAQFPYLLVLCEAHGYIRLDVGEKDEEKVGLSISYGIYTTTHRNH